MCTETERGKVVRSDHPCVISALHSSTKYFPTCLFVTGQESWPTTFLEEILTLARLLVTKGMFKIVFLLFCFFSFFPFLVLLLCCVLF